MELIERYGLNTIGSNKKSLFKRAKSKILGNSLEEQFRKLIPNEANVIRDGTGISIPAENLVVGDIVYLKAGDKIPADIRIFQKESLQALNPLDGNEYKCSIEPTSDDIKDSRNIVFGTSSILLGKGIGIVIHTGNDMLIVKNNQQK